MKDILDMYDPWSTHSYLNTSKDFEQIFDIEDPAIKDKKIFANKIEEFGHKFMAKIFSASKAGSNVPSPRGFKENSVSSFNLPPTDSNGHLIVPDPI